MSSKKPHCIYPFDSLFLSGDAEFKFCCASRSILGNANVDKPEDAMNGELAKEIRRAMLKGEWHPNCIICQEIEEVNGKSTRTTETWNLDFETLSEDDFKLEYIDLRWNNTCNLSCNYCVPEFSHKWAKIEGKQITKIHKTNEDDLLNFIDSHKKTVTKIYLLGGEPLLHKQNLKLTDLVPDAFYYILTNLAVEDLEKNANVKKFLTMQKFNWGVSFETIGPRLEYVRHGADWNVFDHNIKYIQNKANEQGFLFSAHPLYCIYSAYNLVEYYDYVLENKLFNGGIYWQTLLHRSGGLINKMTKKMKNAAIEEIERCSTKYPEAPGLSMLQEIKQQLILDLDAPVTASYMSGILEEFHKLENAQLTDKKYSFAELWPEVNNWLKEGTLKDEP